MWGALVTGTRDYVRKNGFRQRRARPVRRHRLAPSSPRSPPTRWAPTRCTSSACRRAGPASTRVADAEDLAAAPGAALVAGADRRRWSTPTSSPSRSPGWRSENLQARVRGHAADGAVQPARPPGAHHRQQERAGHRLLHALRRQRRRLRADQGRAEVAGVGSWPAGATRRPRRWGRPRRSRRAASTSRRAPSSLPGQLDSDRLPDYAVLDALLDAYVERDLGRAELVERGLRRRTLVDRVVRLVDVAEYKRRQYPPGPKITAPGLRPRPPAARSPRAGARRGRAGDAARSGRPSL